LAVWYQHDKNSIWKDIEERKIRRLSEMTLKKDDTQYFRLSRGYTPWDTEPTKGPVIPIGDHEVYSPDQGMTGTPAAYIAGFLPQAGANWYRITGHQPALDLGGGLARYLQSHGKMLDADTGKVLADHYTHVTHSLLSNLAYALTAGDMEMVKWVKRGYDYIANLQDEGKTGILMSDPTCSCFVADMINIGIMFSQAGIDDYWEEVDIWTRNTFANLQIQDKEVEGIKALPVSRKTGLEPGFKYYDDGADRARGGWYHSITPYARNRSIGCCNGNCSRAVYYIWDNIFTSDGNELRVNLALNRASSWADINSYLPYKGKVEIKMKKTKKNLSIRIPEWTNWNKVECTVNREQRDFEWSGSYINVGKVKSKDSVVVRFPMKDRSLTTIIRWTGSYIPGGGKREGERPCEVKLKGNTIVGITPDYGILIAKKHEKYQGKKVPMRKVTRFVSNEHFIW